jgi:hypothetical protein
MYVKYDMQKDASFDSYLQAVDAKFARHGKYMLDLGHVITALS